MFEMKFQFLKSEKFQNFKLWDFFSDCGKM
jgi:hypothetical protein